MISRFPIFSPLTLADKTEVYRRTRRFPPYSDFNFVSLFAWNQNSQVRLSILNDNLVIALPDYLSNEITYSILGSERIDESIRQLLVLTDTIRMVPEVTARNLADSAYHIKRDRDNYDYLYLAAQIASFKSGDYKSKRNKANGFVKSCSGRVKVLHHRTLSSRLLKEILGVVDEWSSIDREDNPDPLPERSSITRLLDHRRSFNLWTTELRVDERLIGFSINEVLGRFALCHFEKTLLSHHVHSATYLTQQVAIQMNLLGCRYLNWEQDLGLKGLRRSKLSYHPQRFLKKYTVSLM